MINPASKRTHTHTRKSAFLTLSLSLCDMPTKGLVWKTDRDGKQPFSRALAYHSICLVNTNWSHLVLLQPLLEINVCGACSLQCSGCCLRKLIVKKNQAFTFYSPIPIPSPSPTHLLGLGYLKLTSLTHTAWYTIPWGPILLHLIHASERCLLGKIDEMKRPIYKVGSN